MAFSINTNVASLQAQNYLLKSSNFQSQTIDEVTSGLRIVNSGDDAAGLAIANGLRSNEAVLTQGIQNANNGQATLQTIDGGMSNISTLLDRARTLATESASGTFTGDRNTLNSEFQSVISEVTRQATSIGMNQGGQFAQNLSVFIGGGQGATAAQASLNGSIQLDLSSSAVDAQSLGLQGVQASGNTSVDLSAASATSVQSILANTTNTASEAVAGNTSFSFKGPGFSDGNAVGISVNLAGVTDTQTLVTAINAAIQSAGNGNTSAATAFKNANITASVSTTASGTQQLAFSSSSAAFQVQAGDQTANALLGNISSGTTGAALNTTFTGGAALGNLATTVASQPTTISVQFQGAGMTSPTTVAVNVTAQETLANVLTSLTSSVANNSTLAKAGITVNTAASTAGNGLSFQSTSGQNFSVAAGGDLDNLLGLGSTRLGGTSGTVQYASISGSSQYDNAKAQGTASFQVSFNGGAAITLGNVNLSQGDATSGNLTGGAVAGGTANTTTANQLSVSIDGTNHNIDLTTGGHNGAAESLSQVAADITTQLNGAGTATVNSTNQLVITSASKGAASSVVIGTASANDASTALDLTGATHATTNTGLSRTGGDIQNYLNQQIAANSTLAAAGLQATFSNNKLSIASNNGTQFQLNAYASNTQGTLTGGTGGNASITGTDTAAQTITSLNQNLAVTVDSKVYNVTLTTGANRTTADVAADIQNAFTTAGSSATATTDNAGHIVITSGTSGLNSNVSIGAVTTGSQAASALGLSGLSGSGTAATAATAVTGTVTSFPTSSIAMQASGIVGTSSTLTGSFVASTAASVAGTSGTFSAPIVADSAAGDVTSTQLAASALTTNSAATPVVGTAVGGGSNTGVISFVTNAAATSIAGTTVGTDTTALAFNANAHLNLTIDGVNHNVNLSAATNMDTAVAAINAAFSDVGTVASDAGGILTLASTKTGANSQVSLAADGTGNASTLLNLTAASNLGTGSQLDLTIDGVERKVNVGAATTLNGAVAAINTAFTTAVSSTNLGSGAALGSNVASATSGVLTLSSTTTGGSSKISVNSSANGDASALVGLTANASSTGMGFIASQAATLASSVAGILNETSGGGAFVATVATGTIHNTSDLETNGLNGTLTLDAQAGSVTASAAGITGSIASNSNISLTIDGTTRDVNLATSTIVNAGSTAATMTAIAAAINTAFTSAPNSQTNPGTGALLGSNVATIVSGKLVLNSTISGGNSAVTVNTGQAGDASGLLNLTGVANTTGAGSTLNVTVDGVTKTVDLGTSALVTASAAETATPNSGHADTVMNLVTTAINAAFGSSVAAYAAGTLTLASTTTGSSSNVTLTAGQPGDASNIFRLAAATHTGVSGSHLDLTIDGTTRDVDLSTATTLASVVTKINTAFQAAASSSNLGSGNALSGAVASVNQAGELQLTSLTNGASSAITVDTTTNPVNNAAAMLNLTTTSSSRLLGSNLNLTFDGVNKTVDLSSATNVAGVVNAINTAFNPSGPASADVASINNSGYLQLNSNTTGTGSVVRFTTGQTNDASSLLALGSATSNTGANGSSLNLTVDGTVKTVDISTATNMSDVMNAINTAFNPSGTAGGNVASLNASTGALVLTSTTTGANSNVTVGTAGAFNANAVVNLAAGTSNGVAGSHLNLSIDGSSRTVDLSSAHTISDAVNLVNLAFTSAANASTNPGSGAALSGNVASLSQGGAFQLNSTLGIGSTSSIVGLNSGGLNDAAGVLNLGAPVTHTGHTGVGNVGTTSLNLTIDGAQRTVNITNAANMAAVAADINTAFTTAAGTNNVGTGSALLANVATITTGGALVLNSTITGSLSNLQVASAGANNAYSALGLSVANNSGSQATGSGSVTGGNQPVVINSSNSTLDLSVNGTQVQVALTQSVNGVARTLSQIANDIQTAFTNNSIAATASAASGNLVISSTTTGGISNVTVGNNDAFDGATVTGLAGATNAAPTTFGISSANNTLSFQVDGGATQNITLASGAALSATQVSSDINAKLAAANITGVVASLNGSGDLTLQTQFGGSGHSIKVVAGSNDASSTLGLTESTTAASGTDGNVGFGFTGSNLTTIGTGTTPATSPDVLSSGAFQTTALGFSALATGADSQTINVSATDANGATQTANIVLQNNSTTQTGASIDSAVNAINTTLQQSNNSALQSVAAVKYNDAGTEKIEFVSANTQFSVTVGNTGSQTGVGGQGTTVTAAVVGTGSTENISTASGALNAVNALAAATQTLGTAQAAVGKGENLLNYGVSLAQSQVTNEASAESQIRDANLAQEAANLTKAQILVQAGTAALSQANSAPQQLISLLQGH